MPGPARWSRWLGLEGRASAARARARIALPRPAAHLRYGLGEEGFSEHEIAAWLGHSRKGVTARYVHVSKTRIAAMAKALHARRLAALAPAENVVELRRAEEGAGGS